MEKKLTFALSDSDDSRSGALVPGLITVLEGIQDAVRLMVQHLGDRRRAPGQPPRWIRDQSTLRFVEYRTSSFVGDLVVEAPPDGNPYLEDFGDQALDALQKWDGTEGSTLPKDVVDTLSAAAAKLPEGVRFWFGDADNPHKVEIRRRISNARAPTGTTEAMLHGWLREVNWDKRTAQLHDYLGEFVHLRFVQELNGDMLRLATQHVEVRGRGRFNTNGEWTTVEVQRLTQTRSWNEPFDVEGFLNDPNPKLFDPERLVTASEPFDVDEFIRGIREGRDVWRERSE